VYGGDGKAKKGGQRLPNLNSGSVKKPGERGLNKKATQVLSVGELLTREKVVRGMGMRKAN